MKNLLATACTGLVILAALTGCEQKPAAKAERAPVSVNVMTVSTTDEPLWVSVLGQTEGGREVDVRPQVSGIVEEVLFKEGLSVKEGDILYRIDQAPFKAKLNSAAAARRQAEADLAQAKRELARSEKLYKSGAGSQKEYDDALSARKVAQAALEARIAEEHDASISLGWTQVRAPASGLTGKTLVNPGALVTQQTSVLTSITQHDDVRVVFAPSERVLNGARITTENRVVLTDEAGKTYPAKLDFVAQSINPDNNTLLLRARLEDNAGLMPGAFVRAQLMIGTRENAVRVPQKAITQEPDGSYSVFLFKDGKAVSRTVTVDKWVGTDWLVTGGLSSGDRVITNQLLKLRDGAAVRLSTSGDVTSP